MGGPDAMCLRTPDDCGKAGGCILTADVQPGDAGSLQCCGFSLQQAYVCCGTYTQRTSDRASRRSLVD